MESTLFVFSLSNEGKMGAFRHNENELMILIKILTDFTSKNLQWQTETFGMFNILSGDSFQHFVGKALPINRKYLWLDETNIRLSSVQIFARSNEIYLLKNLPYDSLLKWAHGYKRIISHARENRINNFHLNQM